MKMAVYFSIQIFVAFQLVFMVPFMNCMERSEDPPPPRNDDPHGKRPMEIDNDPDSELNALIGDQDMPHFEALMRGQPAGLQHGRMGGSGHGLGMANLSGGSATRLPAAAGPSSSSFAVDHQQQSASALALPHHQHQHEANLHINAGLPEHMGGVGQVAAERDETKNMLEDFTEFLSSIPLEECLLPEGEDFGLNKEPGSASVGPQNGPSIGPQSVQTGIWAKEMTFPSLRQFVSTVLFPGAQRPIMPTGPTLPQMPSPSTRPTLPKMPSLPAGLMKNIEDPVARQQHNATISPNSSAAQKKEYRNLINTIEEETGNNTVAHKTISDV